MQFSTPLPNTDERISPLTKIGAVALNISNLERSLSFYQNNLGLGLIERQEKNASLGLNGRPFLYLYEKPGARRYPRTTGLYHFAILTPSRLELAKILYHLGETETSLEGVADHSVSEALYLSDPDGNGIEIYRDRPQTEWQHDPDGNLQMSTDPLDLDGLLGELHGQPPPWNGLHPNTHIGHVHLHVSRLPESEHFYTNVLGFNLMAQMGSSASFVSAGGYHHHLGLNTWMGVGAPPAPPESAGLRWFTIHLPDADALEQVAGRIRRAGLALPDETSEAFPNSLRLRDPSQNALVLEY